MIGMKLGIDFGSTNLTVFAEGKGIGLSEPSVMIIDSYTDEIIAMGAAARKMAGKLPLSMKEVFPIRDGVISDFDSVCRMLGCYMEKVCTGRLLRPNVLMSVPGTVNETEKKALFEAVMTAGAGRACFVNESLAAAIGAGVSLTEPKGVCVCDIGGGMTDCSVITMGNIAVSKTVAVGGNVFSAAIAEYVHRRHNIEIGRTAADNIKHTAGSAVKRKTDIAVTECGKNVADGLPAFFEITSGEVLDIFSPYLNNILECIKTVIEEITPELCADVSDNGIILTGGTAKLHGIGSFIENATGIKTVVAENNENCAALGLGRLLKDMKYLERNGYIFTSSDRDELEDGED